MKNQLSASRSRKILGYVTFAILASSLSHSAFAMGRRAPASNPTPVSTPAPTPAPTMTPVPSDPTSGSGLSTGAPKCTSSDANHICIGLKLVSYTKNGVAVLPLDKAITLINNINQLWSPCNIAFQLEKYEAVDPTTKGFNYDMNWKSEGDSVRSAFNDHNSFLVVTAGVLSGSTIGVTEMPGAGVYGSLIEKSYAANAMTVGHELGHYQGLYHVSSTTNLMSAYIGSNTSALTASQCSTARSTDYQYWQSMMRTN